MVCPKCGAANPDHAFFCGECGAQLQSALNEAPGPVSLGPEPIKPLIAPPSQPSLLDKPISAQAPLNAPPPSYGTAPPQASATQTAPRVDPYSHGAGLAPPPGAIPPPGTVPGPSSLPAYQQGYFQSPYEGNTSGMGPGYPVPFEARGWTFAGFVPYGLFAFVNGSVLWGVLYFILGLIYSIFIGIQGKELAWQNRRFDSVEQYNETMRIWNIWGIVCLAALVAFAIIYAIFFSMIMAFAMSEAGNAGMTPTP